MKNGWQVAIDLCFSNRENQNVLNSPLFDTETKAIEWFDSLDFSEKQAGDLDIIMMHYNEGTLTDTYLV